jgi:hypothetical protein
MPPALPSVQVSYIPFFLSAVLAVLAIVGTLVVAVLLNRPGARRSLAATRDAHRGKNICEVMSSPSGPYCRLRTGSTWGYCHAQTTPAACAATSICSFAGNGDCVVAAANANEALGACVGVDASTCPLVQFPSCCQCDCETCENESGCALRGLSAGCARANTPQQCAAAGQACKWYC